MIGVIEGHRTRSADHAPVFILPGQTDINVATDNEYLVSRNAVTTNTFLTSQTFDLNGAADASSVPEPASAVLLGAGLLGLAVVRRRVRSEKLPGAC